VAEHAIQTTGLPSVAPDFLGQHAIDGTAKKSYTAFGLTANSWQEDAGGSGAPLRTQTTLAVVNGTDFEIDMANVQGGQEIFLDVSAATDTVLGIILFNVTQAPDVLKHFKVVVESPGDVFTFNFFEFNDSADIKWLGVKDNQTVIGQTVIYEVSYELRPEDQLDFVDELGLYRIHAIQLIDN